MNEARLREEICRVGRSLFERGYVHATAGNISVITTTSTGAGVARRISCSARGESRLSALCVNRGRVVAFSGSSVIGSKAIK